MGALYIGLISGTSVDGIDAVLADFDERPPRVLQCLTRPLAPGLRRALLDLAHPGGGDVDRLARHDNAVARACADAVHELLEASATPGAAIQAIGSHGQTVRHVPDEAEPYTVQLGNPSLLAELTHITVVADFRRRDLAAGGQGAPLAPAFHRAFFRDRTADRAVVNIGGIANLTLLPADPQAPVRGFDSGPGNGLLDAWIEQHRQQSYDRDGAWAGSGRVLPGLLERLLEEPYFARPPPKSTGRDHLDLNWLCRRLAGDEAPADVQATLAELTAVTIAGALRAQAPAVRQLLVCGGGVHNRDLLTRLRVALTDIEVASTAAQGIDPDYLEALGFAWLARRTLGGRPGNLP
ncbi:MAG: anhydro-N-acetylmuramic acid kinase, partial [Candidatus Competibacterales bacterium]|nr:anhydro-N-acetylmuramic acid kinase [Candidatus Competibacterales bacterium]